MLICVHPIYAKNLRLRFGDVLSFVSVTNSEYEIILVKQLIYGF